MTSVSPAVQPFAWSLPSTLPDVLRHVNVLRLPAIMQRTILSLEEGTEKIPPFASLHDALGTQSHAIIAFDPNIKQEAHEGNGVPWLYAVTDHQIDPYRVRTVLLTWVRVRYGDEAFRLLSEEWKGISLINWEILDLQTASPQQKRMLLPELIARWLLKQDYCLSLPSEDGERHFTLRLVPQMSSRYTAELIAEPTIEQGECYSPILTIWLGTDPANSNLYLQMRLSMRRWRLESYVKSDNSGHFLKTYRQRSVYLRRSTGYLDRRPGDEVFTRIYLKPLGRDVNDIQWVGNHPDLFQYLGQNHPPPSVKEFLTAPQEFLHVALIPLTSADAFHSNIATGFFSHDHKWVFDGLSKSLYPIARPLPEWTRVKRGDIQGKRGKKPSATTPSQKDFKDTTRQERFNGLKQMIRPARIELYVDDPENAKRILLETLGVSQTDVVSITDKLHIHEDNELLLEVSAVQVPELVNTLPTTAKNKRSIDHVTVQRRREIARLISTTDMPTGALILLTDYSRIKEKKFQDPKKAIRFGLLDTGRTSQFVVPSWERGKTDKFEMRYQNAIRDLLRSLGYRLNPLFTAPSDLSLPSKLDLMAFWIISLNARHQGESTITIPVAIHVPSGCSHLNILLPAPDNNVSHCPTLYDGIQVIAALEREERHFDEITMRRFFKNVLRNQDGSGATLLMLVEQNLRRVLTELNEQSSKACFHFDGVLDDLPQIRVVRLRYSSDGEAPFCLPTSAMGKYQGLYEHSQSPGVFYSLHNIGERHQSAKYYRLDKMRDPAVNPGTLQIWLNNLPPEDDPASWAAFVHRLRREASHSDIETIYPQPLHDAQDKLSEYIFRPIDPDEEEDDEQLFAEAMAEG